MTDTARTVQVPLVLPEPTAVVLRDVINEMDRAEAKFPNQHISDGTPPAAWRMGHQAAKEQAERTRDLFRRVCQGNTDRGRRNWHDILREEVYEAFAEDDPDLLRAELVQVACVAARWIKDIDRRATQNGDHPQEATDE